MIPRQSNRLSSPNAASLYFRLLVIAAGSVLLIWQTIQAAPSFGPLWTGVTIILFTILNIFFSLPVMRGEMTLAHIILIGGGLLFGGTTAGWAAAAGILLGFGLRHRYFGNMAWQELSGWARWVSNGFMAGRMIVALLSALLLSSFFTQRLTLPLLLSSFFTQRLVFTLLIFAGIHGLLVLIDYWLHPPEPADRPWQDYLALALIELLPFPIILTAMRAYPAIGYGSLFILGSTPLLLTIPLHLLIKDRRALKRRVAELSILQHISEVLHAGLALEDLLSVIHVQVTQLVGVDSFYVALYDPDEQNIWYPLAVKSGQREKWPARPLADRLTDRVIQESKPILFSIRSQDSAEKIDLSPSGDVPAAWLGVPLVAAKRTLGCLAIFSYSRLTGFTQSDLDLLMIISGQTSVAIENALLYEQAQRRAHQLETLVHDLRSPLGSILGALDLVEDTFQDQEDQVDEITAQSVQVARRSTQKALNLVESILDISRLQSGKMELNLTLVDLGELIDELIDDFALQAKKYHVTLRMALTDGLPPVCADRSKLSRVLGNLLDNALKFTPAGGEVACSAETSGPDKVKVMVSDTGPGVPPQFREKIFERFMQVPGQGGRRRGTGLGLAFCKLAVEAHGGQIWVEDRPGGGSVFLLTLPQARETEAAESGHE